MYDSTQWFFAYLDSKYPTTPDGGYGLIDTIHFSIQQGKVKGDGGKEHNNKEFNAIIKKFTGYDNIELLRQRFVEELDSGTWTFNGFAGYADNYITENLPGVENPTYPTPDQYKKQ